MFKARKECRHHSKIKPPGPSHYYQADTLLETFKYLKAMAVSKTPSVIGYEAVGLRVKAHGEEVRPLFLSFDDLMVSDVENFYKHDYSIPFLFSLLS